MDKTKLVAQLYYDVISRVIPGVMSLVMISSALGRDLGSLVADPFLGAPALRGSPLFLGIALVGAAYMLGQLLAPLSDLYERRVVDDAVPRRYWVYPAAALDEGEHPAPVRRFVLRELGGEGEGASPGAESIRRVVFLWYDWLRVWRPDAGGRVEKIRAEYRMFGGVAVASLGAISLHLLRALVEASLPSLSFLLAGLLMAAFSTWGMVRMFRTFQWSVLNQYFVAKEGAPAELPAPPTHVGAGPA